MAISKWVRGCKRAIGRNTSHAPVRRPRLRVETLEDRLTPAIHTWDAGGTGFGWAEAANWDANGVPNSSDDVVIMPVNDDPIQNIPNLTIASIQFTNSGTVNLQLLEPLTIDGLGAFDNIINTSGTNTIFGADIQLVGSASRVVVNGGRLTIASAITGAQQLEKVGPGTLELASSLSTFSGTLFVIAGTVLASAGHNDTNPTSALGDPSVARSIIVQNGATLQFGADDVFGNASVTPVATLQIEGTVTNTGDFFNTLGPVILDSGILDAVGGNQSDFQSYQFTGTVSVIGTAPSTISAAGTNAGIHLSANTTFDVADVTGEANPDLIVSATLTNQNGTLGGAAAAPTKVGLGTLVLSADNTYTGTTVVLDGTLQVGNGGTSGTLGSGDAFNDGRIVFFRNDSWTLPNNVNPTGFHFGYLVFNGNGTGAATVTGTLNSGRVNTTVFSYNGTLVVTGTVGPNQAFPTPTLVAETGGTILGTGSIDTVLIQVGGKLAGGTPIAFGTLNSKSVAFQTGSTFEVVVDGPTAGQFDSLNVVGTVDLGGTTLSIPTGGVAFTAGQSIVIVSNDGNEAITGTFAGIAEGGIVTAVDNRTFRVSYVGGTGNDVTLSAPTTPTTTTVTSSVTPSVFGQSVTFTATVTSAAGTPTGNVTFSVDGVPQQTQPLNGAGQASFTTSSIPVGFPFPVPHSVRAIYNGNANFTTSTGNTTQLVDPANTTATIGGPASVPAGTQITLTATVTANAPGSGVPTGGVDFYVLQNNILILLDTGTLNGAGVATGQVSVSAGANTFVAIYGGSSGNGNYSSSLTDNPAGRMTVTGTSPDSVAPTVTNVTAPNVTLHNNPNPYTFTVTYADNAGGSGIDFTTLDDNDVFVTEPLGFYEPGIIISRNGNVVKYAFPGGFPADFNGTYTIRMNANQVTDIAGNPVAAGTLGTFQVAITTPTPPTNLLVSGPTNGNGLLFTATNGAYGARLAVNLFGLPGAEVHVAMGDVNGDGVDDFVAGIGPGGARVKVISGATGNPVLADFVAFSGYQGGVFVAVGDLNGDGKADVAVTPDAVDAFSGPVSNALGVQIFSGASMTNGTNNPTMLASFDGLASSDGQHGQNNPLVKLGGRPAISDVNGDGRPDLLIAAGGGGGPRITIWSGLAFENPLPAGQQPSVNPIANLFVFENTQRGGAFVAAGDVNGDGFSEIVAGGGPGGGPRLRIVDGKKLFDPAIVPNRSDVNLDSAANLANGLVMANFFSGDSTNRGGVRVTVRDVDGDDFMDVVAGSGSGQQSQVLVYKGSTLKSGNATAAQDLNPFGVDLPTGVWVG